MSFIESPRFPIDISYGSSGGPKYKTTIVQLYSGYEQRNADWVYPLHEYDLQYGIKDIEDLTSVRNFFHVMGGAYIGFRYKDWIDCKSTANGLWDDTVTFSDQTIGTGDGNNRSFQLIKIYVKGSYSRTRIIKKPVSGTVVVGINGVNQSSGWAVDLATGIITFTNAPGNGLSVTAGYEFDIPVRFAEDQMPVSIPEVELGNTTIKLVEIRV